MTPKEAKTRLLLKCLFMSEFAGKEDSMRCHKRVKAAFERIGNRTFEKWRPSKVILDWMQENPEIVLRETLTKFELIFKDVNRILR